MRKINDMIKLIPLDELKGGIIMNETNKTSVTDTKIKEQGAPKPSGIRLRRGVSGIVAAALVLAVGGGAFMYARHSRSAEPAAPISEGESAESSAAADADRNARNIFDLINANIALMIEDGHISKISTGAHVLDIDKPYEQVADLYVRSDPENDGVPDKGEVFCYVDDSYKAVFVQWRSDDNVVGQYTTIENCERLPFGILPEELTEKILSDPEPDAELLQANSHAHAIYDVVNSMLNDYAWGDYPTNQLSAFLPSGEYELIDFDHPDRYADFIYRIKQYSGDTELTGKAFFQYSLGNDLFFLEWTGDDGKTVEIWPYKEGVSVKSFGEVPSSGAYEYYTETFEDTNLFCELGCERKILQFEGHQGRYDGVITDAGELPQVQSWYYYDFLQNTPEPVPFDPDKIMTIEEIDTVISFDWIDHDRKERVYIRTSDMEGANIYVNGRYYNVEDNSILSLLDDGMPRSIQDLATDKTAAQKLLDGRINKAEE